MIMYLLFNPFRLENFHEMPLPSTELRGFFYRQHHANGIFPPGVYEILKQVQDDKNHTYFKIELCKNL